MKTIVLGLYLPIICMSVPAVWLLIKHFVWPSVVENDGGFKRMLLGLSAVFSLSAHAIETPFYAVVRLFPSIQAIEDWYPIVGFSKLLIAMSCVFALAGFSMAVTGKSRLGQSLAALLVLWVLGYWLVSVLA